MSVHFDFEVTYLNQLISSQSIAVETAVKRAAQAVSNKDAPTAIEVEQNDDKIDEMEVRIEEECLKVLALHQPVAGDLRYIITLLKVNTELERIGDLAVYIARRAIRIANGTNDEQHSEKVSIDFSDMIYHVIANLKMALDSFLFRDSLIATKVIESDEIIDHFHRENKERIGRLIKEHPKATEDLLDYLAISRSLERIADSCTNIGEDVLYAQQGKIVRHSKMVTRPNHPSS